MDKNVKLKCIRDYTLIVMYNPSKYFSGNIYDGVIDDNGKLFILGGDGYFYDTVDELGKYFEVLDNESLVKIINEMEIEIDRLKNLKNQYKAECIKTIESIGILLD